TAVAGTEIAEVPTPTPDVPGTLTAVAPTHTPIDPVRATVDARRAARTATAEAPARATFEAAKRLVAFLPVVWVNPVPPTPTPPPWVRADMTATAEAAGTPTTDPFPRPLLGRNSEAGSGPAPESARLFINGRVNRCSAAPMADGFYTARHCLEGQWPWQLTVVGCDACMSASLDPTRDLAHIAGPGSGSVALYTPAAGEILTWANARANGAVRVLGEYDAWGTYPGLIGRGCNTAAPTVRGDSGTGLYDAAGRLGGIIAYADLNGSLPDSVPQFCGAGEQRVWYVGVP
ncbi:MAG: hypothetical protein DYG90_03965, partial [Chloroflexi bacterium CFX6]|nr:hypothetical protein [Chloroflexi bacterium CFX6]